MAKYKRRRRVQRDSRPPPQHLFRPQPQQLAPHSGGPASGIWCDRCGRAGHQAKICAAREPRRFNEICGTGYNSPMLPPSYSGRNCGTGCDILQSPPAVQQSYRYRAKPFVRHHSGGDGTALSPQQQPAPRPFCSFGWEQRYNDGHSTALWPPQQPAPRPFCSFGWDQRYACHDKTPVNAGLANHIAQGQAQRDVGVDDQEEQQRPSTEVDYYDGPLSEVFGPPKPKELQRTSTELDCHGGPVSEVFEPPEASASLARGGLPLPPSGTLSPPTAVISDSAFEEWLHSDDMEMAMFSLSGGPQQSAPTAVALAEETSAAAAATGTRVFPAVSSKGVAEAPASLAGAASAAVPAAVPATGGTVFSAASVGGAARAPAFADRAALTAAPGSGGTVPSAASVGGVPASSAVAASGEISAAEPATSGIAASAAPIRGAVGGRESSTGAVSSDAEAEAAPSTSGTAAPVKSAARAARALESAAGSTGDSWVANTCGERGASTHPFDPGIMFPLETSYNSDERTRYNSSSGSSSSSSSSNNNTSDRDSWWDATCVGALLRPFDPGKRCWRSTRRGKAGLGVALPFDRGKAWGRMQHGG